MSVQYVHRLVVDHWPTLDGEPFAYQGFEYWEAIVEAHRDGKPTPSWLPDNFDEWITGVETDSAFGRYAPSPAKSGYAIAWSDRPDYTTGYGGDGCHLMNVPHATARRYFAKSALTQRLADLLAWGCEARIERAPIGEWEDVA